MVRKTNIKQSNKQTVVIHLADTRRKKRKRNYKKRSSSSSGVSSYIPMVSPVYIQNQPSPVDNPLYSDIRDILKSYQENALIKTVPTKGHIEDTPKKIYHRNDNPNIGEVYESNETVSPMNNPMRQAPLIGGGDVIPEPSTPIATLEKTPRRGRGRPPKNDSDNEDKNKRRKEARERYAKKREEEQQRREPSWKKGGYFTDYK